MLYTNVWENCNDSLSDCHHFSLSRRVKADSAAPAAITFFRESRSMPCV